MKKLMLILSICMGFVITYAQGTCPCEMENKTDALLAVAMSRTIDYNSFSLATTDTYSNDPWSAVGAICGALLTSLPDSKYALKVTFNDGKVGYKDVTSCQLCLEYTYDILQVSGVSAVRIIAASTYNQYHPSCANKTYTPSDLSDVKYRRDHNFN